MALDRRRCRVGQSLMVVMLLLLVMVSVLALTLDFGFVLAVEVDHTALEIAFAGRWTPGAAVGAAPFVD